MLADICCCYPPIPTGEHVQGRALLGGFSRLHLYMMAPSELPFMSRAQRIIIIIESRALFVTVRHVYYLRHPGRI